MSRTNNNQPRSARQRAARQARKGQQGVSSESVEDRVQTGIYDVLAASNKEWARLVAAEKRKAAILEEAAVNPMAYKMLWDWAFGDAPKSKL